MSGRINELITEGDIVEVSLAEIASSDRALGIASCITGTTVCVEVTEIVDEIF